MFQNFEERSDPAHGRPRLALLRAELARRGLDGFILPRTDAHQSEYLPARDERLAWLTGFTGSAGAAVILKERAAIFVDGRYTVQVAAQVDTGVFEIVHLVDRPPADWIGEAAEKKSRLGFDPWLHTPEGLGRLRAGAEKAGVELVAVDTNPVDAVWQDQPAPPTGPVEPHPLELAGEETGEKLARLRETLAADRDQAVILSLGDSIAWLFNIRGSDIAHTPVALAFAIVGTDTATLFCDGAKIGTDAARWLQPHAAIASPDDLGAALDALGSAGARVRIDPSSTAVWIADRLKAAGSKLHKASDPVIAHKARKNATEIAGSRAAHARDALALARFLHWLDTNAASGDIDEIGAVTKLEALRAASNELRDISFDTIAGAGPNGAIVHYRVTHQTNRKLTAGSLFLVDSGAQYRDGTTDVTRTVAIGEPTAQMRRLFTLVLKGHIAISRARFPKGTTGSQLDALARSALWHAGHDYDHGTGHGVGSYLSVHEGPQRISKRGGDVALEPGMIVSNEPGVYLEGAFGIRIENLVLVTGETPIDGGERPMLGFEVLTLAPIDRRLIDPGLLDAEERDWLDTYHARVRSELAAGLDGPDRDWLIAATQPL